MILESNHILSETALALKQLYGNRLDKVLLYGSYARGEENVESDIDLLVLLNDNLNSSVYELKQINRLLFPLKLKYNLDIAVYPVSRKKFLTEKNFFFARIKQEGIEL